MTLIKIAKYTTLIIVLTANLCVAQTTIGIYGFNLSASNYGATLDNEKIEDIACSALATELSKYKSIDAINRQNLPEIIKEYALQYSGLIHHTNIPPSLLAAIKYLMTGSLSEISVSINENFFSEEIVSTGHNYQVKVECAMGFELLDLETQKTIWSQVKSCVYAEYYQTKENIDFNKVIYRSLPENISRNLKKVKFDKIIRAAQKP